MEGIDWSSVYWLQAMGSAVVAGGLGLYLFTYRHIPGTRQLSLLMAAVAQWALTYALEFKTPGLAAKLFWVRLEYLGGAWTGVLFFAFALFITGHEHWLDRRRWFLLCLVPAATPVLAWTNDLHGLMWHRAWLDLSGPIPLVAYERGPLFWVFIAFSYLALLAGVVLLLATLRGARHLYRRQLQLVLAGGLTPWICHAVYMTGLIPLPHLDLTPFSFTVSGVACAVALFRHRLMDIVPLARAAIMEGIGDAVLVVDRTRRLIDCNRAAQRLLGIRAHALTGDQVDKVLPEFGPRLLDHLGQDPVQVELEARLPGADGYFHLRVFPLVARNGRRSGWLALVQDVTQRRQDEMERETLLLQLQRAQKMEAVGTLAGGVAHDLNNVLSGIVSYPDLLLMGLPADSDLRKPIETIQASGQKAAAIVQDLLTLARRNVTTREVVDLDEVVEGYLASPEFDKLRAFHPRVTIRHHLSAGAAIEGSPVQLCKAVMNLVSNAVEAMPEGGVLSIETACRHLRQPVQGYEKLAPGRYTVLTVSDTGVGISREDRERIFDPFYTKKKMGRSGTGLGMTVVWGTVKDHRGYIDIESRPGGGTTFRLFFPVTGRTAGMPAAAAAAESFRGRGESVLVVDDAAEQREILTGMLVALGYRVEAAASGEEAVARAAVAPPDLLVLDMVMAPGMDGLSTYEAILLRRPGQRAVIASGYAEDDRVRRARRLGAGRYVRKPYRMHEIAAAVRAELDRETRAPAANAAGTTAEPARPPRKAASPAAPPVDPALPN